MSLPVRYSVKTRKENGRIPNSPCLVWLGAKDRYGYGRTSFRGRRGITAHRAVWFEAGREVPGGMELDHLCRNRACINIDHLRTVTHQENVANRVSSQYRHVCRLGHRKKRQGNGRMVCYVCMAAHVKEWRLRKRYGIKRELLVKTIASPPPRPPTKRAGRSYLSAKADERQARRKALRSGQPSSGPSAQSEQPAGDQP